MSDSRRFEPPLAPRPRRRPLVVAAVWTAMVVAFLVYEHSSGESPTATAQRLVAAARGNWWALLAYLAISVVRPVVMFPATLVTVAAGMLFGPALGIGVAVVAASSSALVVYSIGRRVGRAPAKSARHTALEGWIERLRSNSFESVLVMRLLFLPYDLVNYWCGLIGVRRRQFLAATMIGSLPGTVAFVLIGASITRLDQGVSGIDRSTLLWSSGLIGASIVASRVLRRSSPNASPPVGPPA
jgi:uncharacterized membrane protein YdjX (TVP38/TMEM64 family)